MKVLNTTVTNVNFILWIGDLSRNAMNSNIKESAILVINVIILLQIPILSLDIKNLDIKEKDINVINATMLL